MSIEFVLRLIGMVAFSIGGWQLGGYLASRTGGSLAAPRESFASSEAWGHSASSAFFLRQFHSECHTRGNPTVSTVCFRQKFKNIQS